MSEKKKETKKPVEDVQETETPDAAKTPEQDPVEEKLKQAEEQVLALNDKLLRTLAEYDNFRKRSVKEKEAIYPEAAAEAVAKFLPVLDSMERAAGFACNDEEYKKGVDMIIHSFYDALAAVGVQEIPAEAGSAFDPAFHNAVMHIEDENLGTGVIAQVFQKGYQLGERVIRHTMVQVAN
ncbi:MAG: nucleotide exchange factor GrpE [Oscillospiraceae bacterium]|nr:nucleotide exchange factor GrpE [Oscillospiraceae bacterium]